MSRPPCSGKPIHTFQYSGRQTQNRTLKEILSNRCNPTLRIGFLVGLSQMLSHLMHLCALEIRKISLEPSDDKKRSANWFLRKLQKSWGLVYLYAHFTPVFSCMSWVLRNVLKEIYQFSNIFVNPIKVKSPHIHRSYLPWTQHSPPFTVHSMYYILMIMRSLCNFTQSMFWYPPWQYMHCIDLCLSCQLLPCVQSLVCNVFYELQCALCKVQSRMGNMHCTICTVQ